MVDKNTAGASSVLASRIESLVRPEIRAMSAYHVADASGMLKLDAMENPFSWSDQLRQSWLEYLQDAALNRYPDPQAVGVKAGLRQAMGVDASYELLLGNGSDEIIQMLAIAVAAAGKTIMAPEPSFVMYQVIARFVGMEFVGVPLQDDFDLDLEAMLAAVKQYQPSLIFLALPNNPTGNLFSEHAIRAIIEASTGLVILDEAYMAFTQRDHLALLAEYDNVLVMRTVSKIGLAGLRLGLLIGDPLWLQEIEKVRMPYNINILTQRSAEFALQHYAVLMAQAQEIRAQRAALLQQLQARAAVDVWASEANFLLLRCKSKAAAEVFANLKAQGVLVKLLDGAHPLLSQCLRITVSTAEENRQFLEALDRSV
jgi:histidinol-phosphate aminotransferase